MKHIGRKLYHLLGGLGLLAVYYSAGREQALIFYAVLFFIVFTSDAMRLLIPAINRFLFTRYSSFIRKSEENKFTGTAPYVLGVGVSFFLYSPEVATMAVCFLVFGDVAATTIGELYGRTKIRDKSLEGSLAFVLAALLAGFLLLAAGISLPLTIMIAGAFIAAGVELLPLPINDNLMIPLVTGGIMELALKIFR
ncbi:MAG: hypothetical protein WC539_10520 [Nitrospirota bacterium]